MSNEEDEENDIAHEQQNFHKEELGHGVKVLTGLTKSYIWWLNEFLGSWKLNIRV